MMFPSFSGKCNPGCAGQGAQADQGRFSLDSNGQCIAELNRCVSNPHLIPFHVMSSDLVLSNTDLVLSNSSSDQKCM